MEKLKFGAKASGDAYMDEVVDEFYRRAKVTPPGTCPVAVQLSLLQASGCQSCGKCTPCREGIPQLESIVQDVLAGIADPSALDQMRRLATNIADTADCAIGWRAAEAFLEGLDTFAYEYEAHVYTGTCTVDIGQTVPCETMCPAHVDAPAYIALAAQGKLAESIMMIRKDNPFPTACAYMCEHPCESRCRRTLIDSPVNIRGIKKYVVDNQPANEVPTPEPLPATGKKIAVVGGGASGMTCAYYLALMGHTVEIFEAHKKLGGMMRYGIPAYRFPRERLDVDIEAVLGAGDITVHTETKVDAESLKKMAEEYDAVYVAIGAQIGKTIQLEGSDAEGVMSAVELLGKIGDNDYPDFTGKKVVVIGGGNVAMDCARTSVRAGAESVTVAYRRREEDMTAQQMEIDSAKAEGVEILTLQAPDHIVVEDGHVAGLVTQPQYISKVKRGRPAPVAASKPQVSMDADVILIAAGQAVETAPFEEVGLCADRGTFNATPYLQSSCQLENVFIGGDCQNGPKTVILAVGAGKVAARNIDMYLGFEHELDCGASVPVPQPIMREACGRVNIVERPARERKNDFDAVEMPMSEEEAIQEASRCLRCDHYGCGAMEGGRVQYV